MDRATFYKKLSAKTDAELVHIINEQREDYQQTAIDVVEEILNERELHDQINEIESNQEAENHPKNYDKTPLWGGIGLFIFNVFPARYDIVRHQFFAHKHDFNNRFFILCFFTEI